MVNQENHMSHHENNPNLETQKQQDWEEQGKVLKSIYEQGVASVFAKLDSEKLSKVFAGKEKLSVCCMDEGCSHFGDIRSAGPMLLIPKSERGEFIKKNNITRLCPHAGCGAAKLWAAENNLVGDPDQLALAECKKIAEEYSIECEYVDQDRMKRPAEYHNARMIYVDGTGKFQFNASSDLPRGFVISPAWFVGKTAMENLALALKIAFGDHGFGNKFTDAEPMLITIIGNPNESELSAEKLNEQVAEVVSEYGGRVKVDAYIPPSEVVKPIHSTN